MDWPDEPQAPCCGWRRRRRWRREQQQQQQQDDTQVRHTNHQAACHIVHDTSRLCSDSAQRCTLQSTTLRWPKELSYVHRDLQSSKRSSHTNGPHRRHTSLVKLYTARALVAATALAVLLLLCNDAGGGGCGRCDAYQLTNNLIANNLPPKFTSSLMPTGGTSAAAASATSTEIVVRVKEGAQSVGKLICTLRGEDPDDDPLTFGVLGSLANELLRIENVPNNQANVYLRKELDRETTESYQVVITLTDGKLGRGNWITKSMLIIVEDINDNYPVFGPHRTAITIREDARAPLVVETLEASDQDEGRFGQVIYRLDELDDSRASTSSGQQQQQAPSRMFAIETVDGKGVISLVGQLDYEQRSLYQLRVTAIDRAVEHERLSTSTAILISVEDCEDQPPMFTFVPSITRIPENLAIGSPVVRASAIDGDRGVNNRIQYALVAVNAHESGPERNLFSMNADTGQISVAHELDREAPSNSNKQQPGSYVLQVRATEVGGSAAESSVQTELTVILTDVNDEAPTFSKQHYHAEVLENSPAESLVALLATQPSNAVELSQQQQQHSGDGNTPLVAKVFDRDQGTNGTFTLHLEGEHAHLFDVWPREATNEASFVIKVASIQATGMLDADAPPKASQLDYELTKSFELLVVAREKYPSAAGEPLRSSVAQVSVFVRDANDNYPQFDSDTYRVEIPENAVRGMHVCAVRAHDADSGIFGTAGIRYTELRGEKASKFKLDPVSGVVTLKTSEHGFDRETVAQHHLIVEARDANGAGNRNTTQILIVLTDVNDQRPKFLLEQYEAFIYENEPDFQSPLQVQAVDNDAPNTNNSRVTYSIVAGDAQHNFTIDAQTGRIRVRNSLHLGASGPSGAVAAAAAATSRQTNSGESDIVLETSSSSLPLASGAPAVDQPPLGGGLDFEGIAQKSRDETRQFNLTVRATDNGSPEPLSDTARVLVLVYDRNDHAPVFTRNVYTKSIREDAKEGAQVVRVLAHDGDHSLTNSKITYRISSGASDKFAIDPDSGLISVATGANLDIDRAAGGGQRRSSYLLSVLASDGSFGASQKSASALVNITIIDVNNKPPEFVSLGAVQQQQQQRGAVVVLQPGVATLQDATATSNSTTSDTSAQVQAAGSKLQQQQQQLVVYVNEDAPYGLIVTRVIATDPDVGAELRYSINWARSEARNEDMMLVEPALVRDLFTIDPHDGTIKVARQLDRELFDQVKLRVQVEDVAAQTPDQVAHAHLLVRVADVNDNKPTFKRQLYKAVVNENSISGTSIVTVVADDRDLNKTLRYSLEGAPELLRLVRINPRSGEVLVNDRIDRETYSLINVTVRADDFGQPQSLSGTCQLSISVRDENDNNPMFLSHNALGGDDEAAVAVRAALDADNLTSESRALERLGAQSTPAPQNHQMSSAAPDRLRALNTPVESTMPSANEPLLPFLSPGSSASVREDAPVGTRVAYVRADDADYGNNGRVTYLLDASSSQGRFRVDRDSGIISVAGQLDRETQRAYALIIEACDNYDLGYATGESRRAFAQVTIFVSDVNDNAPLISSSGGGGSSSGPQVASAALPSYDELMASPGPYEAPLADCVYINEFQAPNEPIVTLTATDLDDPAMPGGQIDLSILNVGSRDGEPLFALHTSSVAAAAPAAAAAATSTALTPTLISEEPAGDETSSESAQPELVTGGDGALAAAPQRSKRSYARVMSAPQRRSAIVLLPNATPTQTQQLQRSPLAGAFGERVAHLVVRQSLRERVGNYSLLVRASDRGQPPLSSVRLINVCVLDVNNHAPVFVRPALNHTIRVPENATIGSFVTQVEATDADHGQNGDVAYALKSLVDSDAFKIDRITGTISTARKFNRLLKRHYTLRVQAHDFGEPTRLSSDIDINIMIVNAGQHQPEFETSQTQVIQFTENVAPGVEWATLLPTTNQDDDDDGDDNSQATKQASSSPCYFIVDSDDHERVFRLDRHTHRLTNAAPLDRERQANYTLLVQASNSCQHSTPSPIYVPRAPSTAAAPLQSGVATSTPPTIEYRARSRRHAVRVKLNTGSSVSRRQSTASPTTTTTTSSSTTTTTTTTSTTTTTAAPFAAHEAAEPHALTMASAGAADGNQPLSQAAVDALLAADKTLLKVVIKVKDVNDNAPKFTQRVYTGGITTEADFGTVFMIVQALDADADANSQVVYSIVKPIRRQLASQSSASGNQRSSSNNNNSATIATTNNQTRVRTRRAAAISSSAGQSQEFSSAPGEPLVDEQALASARSNSNDLLANLDNDDLFVINAQTGEISLNFDPQKHMKGYFEFEIMANDTDGLFDSARVLIYLLRQDQRVKFVLRLAPQELRARLNKFRSVFGNITGAIVNIDSYKYYENHDGTVDKKKTSLYLHFVNPDDNTIIDVDKVLTLIDNNIEYLDELYKEFHVLSSEAAHLPLSSSALIDPMDQVRTGLLGVASFLTLILILVIALCVHQRARYERQLKAATVSAFGSSPLHLDPDYRGHSNLPNTNLHSQAPNPIWMSGYAAADQAAAADTWLAASSAASSATNTGGGGAYNNGLVSRGHSPVRNHTKRLAPGAVKSPGDNVRQQQQQQQQQRAKRLQSAAAAVAGELTSASSGLGGVGVGIEDADYLTSSTNGDDSSAADANSLHNVRGRTGVHAHHASHLHNQSHHYNAPTAATVTPRDSLNSSHGRHSGSGSSSTTTNERQALCNSKAAQQQQQQQQQAQVHPSAGRGAKEQKQVVVMGANANNKLGAVQRTLAEQAVAAKEQQQRSHQIQNAKSNGVQSSTHSTFGAYKEVTIYTDTNNQYAAVQQQQQHRTHHKIAAATKPADARQMYQVNGQDAQQRIIVHSNDANALGQQQQHNVHPSPANLGASAAHAFESNLSKLSILNLETTEL